MWVNQPVSIKNDAKVSHSKSLLVLQLGGGFYVVQNQYTSYHVNIYRTRSNYPNIQK